MAVHSARCVARGALPPTICSIMMTSTPKSWEMVRKLMVRIEMMITLHESITCEIV